MTVEDLLDTGEYETVYNLRVGDFHTYFVGGEDWSFSVWAHNACVYQSVNPNTGDVLYVGKADTGMAGRSTLADRLKSAFKRTGYKAAPIPGLTDLAPEDAAAVEAALIRDIGRVDKGTGTLRNRNWGIDPKRPNYEQILDRGRQLLRDAGYPGY